jgi:hypothetical protein
MLAIAMMPIIEQSPFQWVQACITNVSFPRDLAGLESLLDKNQFIGKGITDLETLLHFDPDYGLSWTAPKWMTEGDILFFYHAVMAKPRIASLRKQVRKICPERDDLTRVLERAAELANLYSGKIFACSRLIGPPERFEPLEEAAHFKSRIFGLLERVDVFQHPLHINTFGTYVKINRQSALTPLAGSEFMDVRGLLAEANLLPEYLERAKPGGVSFRHVDSSNWRAISCSSAARFIDESQVRSYLIDYLLNEIKDRSSPLLQECRCYKGGYPAFTGYADYFIRLHDTWVPVEAKLSVLAECNLAGQIEKYIQVSQFIPVKGPYKGKVFQAGGSRMCLVIDQFGLYVTCEPTTHR